MSSVPIPFHEVIKSRRLSPTRPMLAVVHREVVDSLRDWRIVVPIIVLTLFFPLLMSFVANAALRWVAKYGNPIIGERLLPFMLMVVGFFPISFSLVIALETFVGERERRSLEPLLMAPLTDTRLYLGKVLGALLPPMLAAYLGIGTYLLGLYVVKAWTPPIELLALVFLLTTMEGCVMVAGAVVISSQTTSVRAANLLASFIIIPAALLEQDEAMIMFYANYDVLWWIVLFLAVVTVILVRMGVHTFNREELLGRDTDALDLPSLGRAFLAHFDWRPWWFGRDVHRMPAGLRWLGKIGGLYRYEIPAILRRVRPALVAVSVGLLASVYIGYMYAARYPLPATALQLDSISMETFSTATAVGWFPGLTVQWVLSNNIRSLLLAALLAVFSFGALAEALLMAPLAIVFFFAAQAGRLGTNPILFLGAFVLPHGVLELPAAIIATALAIRLGAIFLSIPRELGMTIGESWLWALADFIKAFLAFVVPLLTVAAILEVHVTPLVVVWAFGGS